MNKKIIRRILKEQSIWEIGNNYLYELFKKYPRNTDPQEIIAKMWLLGRAYSASIERRKFNRNISNDEFYGNKVTSAIRTAKLDNRLRKIIACKNDIRQLDLILSTHKELQNEIWKITRNNKRSLCSKYLHFHLPNLFYIFDSRAVKGLGRINKSLPIPYRINNRKTFNSKWDKDYANYYMKSEYVRKYLENKLSITLSIREFDSILISSLNYNFEIIE